MQSGGTPPTGTFAFSHAHALHRTARTVTVTVRNTVTGTSNTGSFSVAVNVGQIFLGIPIQGATADVNGASWGCGSFFDGNAVGGSWTATVNYGDNTE